MSDSSTRAGGRQPTNRLAANTYNPIAGPSANHLTSIPPGTPVFPSRANAGEVVAARGNVEATSHVVGLAAETGVVGNPVLIQTEGTITLTTAQWDVITRDVGGLVPGVPYFLSTGFREGVLTRTEPVTVGQFDVQVGIGLSPTDFLIQICCAQEIPSPRG